jgi:hypothetical protein
MPTYRSEFPVAATPEKAWQVLTDFARYSEWNPQIPRIEGPVELNGVVRLTLMLPRRPSLNLTARLTAVGPTKLLKWKGHLLAPWFFRGERIFAIEPSASVGVVVLHSEDVSGLISPLFALLMNGPVTTSHEELNDAFKRRCEATV